MNPGSPEWLKLVTASKVPAILGVSPWESPRSLWHKMRGDVPAEEQRDYQARGHYLEPAILAWWRDRHEVLTAASVVIGDNWAEVWEEQPDYTLDDWAGATPDARAWVNGAPVLVEAKSASRDDDWGDPGTDAIPDYYLLQVQWQMHVSGIHRCYVPMIGPRLDFREYVVDYHQPSGALLEQRCREFYDSLTADEPPPLDDTVATFNAIKKVHPDIDRGTEVEVTRAQAVEVAEAKAALDAAEARDRLARSVVIDAMGRAQHAVHDGRKVARRQPRGDAVTFVVTAKPEHFTSEEDAA